jgi:hypothetical protein
MPIDIQLQLEENSILTSFLQESPEIKSKMIFLGYTLYQDCKQMISGWDKSDYHQQVSALQETLVQQTKQMDRLTTTHVEELGQITQEVKQRTMAKYNLEMEELHTKCKTLQEQLDSVCMTLTKQHQNTLDEKMDALRATYEDKLQQERDKVLKYMTVSENSSVKGQIGEEYTYHQLNLLFPKLQVEDTHLTDARGDFILHNEDCMMMVEAKQYQKNVPLVEIEKFHRDMQLETNKDVQCGVMISLDSGICGKEDFHMEFVGGKPVVYLHHTRNQMHHIKLAFKLFHIVLRQETLDTKLETAVTMFKALGKKLKRNYNKQKNIIDKHRAEQLKQVHEQQSYIVELYSQLGLSIQF